MVLSGSGPPSACNNDVKVHANGGSEIVFLLPFFYAQFGGNEFSWSCPSPTKPLGFAETGRGREGVLTLLVYHTSHCMTFLVWGH
jgi:hypothetical protein